MEWAVLKPLAGQTIVPTTLIARIAMTASTLALAPRERLAFDVTETHDCATASHP
jgi:hypothetical protein